MRKRIEIEIRESEAELQKLIRNAQGRLQIHRLSALFLFKTGQARTYSAIGKLLGYERHTVSMWFSKYVKEGMEGLLQVDKPGPKEKTKITPKVMECLRTKLDEDILGFGSYKEIQHWLADACNVKLSYSTVHSIVRYELGLDLKRMKRQAIAEEAIKVVAGAPDHTDHTDHTEKVKELQGQSKASSSVFQRANP